MLREKSSLLSWPLLGFLGFFLMTMPCALFAQRAYSAAQQTPSAGSAQEPAQPTAPQPGTATAAPAQNPNGAAPSASDRKPPVHRFWDKKNDWLFAGVGASRVLDFTSTRNFRRRGRNEGLLNNDTVDNLPAFAVIEAAATAASIGVSYWFHRKGHHRLERWTSYVHMGVSFFGDARNYALETPHRGPLP